MPDRVKKQFSLDVRLNLNCDARIGEVLADSIASHSRSSSKRLAAVCGGGCSRVSSTARGTGTAINRPQRTPCANLLGRLA
jgi:hypothetical protein